MARKKKGESFWTGYSDLMTNLFFVMLMLFVLAIALLHKQVVNAEKARIATQTQLDKITEIQKATENIDDKYFEYDSIFKRHTIKNINVSFQTGSPNIYDISDIDRLKLLKAGRAIYKFMSDARKSLPDAQYLLIIEGQSSKDNYVKNYELSYERALALYNFWLLHNVAVNNLGNCEIIISGSGQTSHFRLEPDSADNKGNQRFVIHIIPKPGIVGE